MVHRSHLVSCTCSDGVIPSSSVISRHNVHRNNIIKVAMHTNTSILDLMKMPLNLLTAIIEDLNQIMRERNGG